MDRIGRYTVEGELGRGGCGIVYLARDQKMNRLVAVKTILTKELERSSGGQGLKMRLEREAQSAGSLNHSAIVTVYELGEENDVTYFVMEYVDGPPLDTMMNGGPLAFPRAIELLREVAAGLDFAHSKGIIHRDVKPANILVSSGGRAKVSDFGVAKILDSTTMTTTGVAIGTPAYMSPEQILTKPLDGRSDQFSLGVIAFEMVTGRKPFHADSLPGLIHQILSVEPPSAAEINAAVGEPAASVLRRVLHKEATERYETCAAFVDALEAALVRGELILPAPVATSTQKIEKKAQTQPPQTSGAGVKAGLALACSIALAAFVYSRSHQAPVTPAAAPVTASTASPAAAPPPVPTEPAKPVAEAAAEKREAVPVKKETPGKKEKAPEAAPVAAAAADPGPDQPATSYMGSPEGRFTWTGALPAGERLVIVRNRVRMGTVSGNALPAGVPVQVEVRPADIRVMQQPAAANGFRLILSNATGHEISTFTVLWREQGH